jgi:hypothetical protein
MLHFADDEVIYAEGLELACPAHRADGGCAVGLRPPVAARTMLFCCFAEGLA